jgi:hypothetical protein
MNYWLSVVFSADVTSEGGWILRHHVDCLTGQFTATDVASYGSELSSLVGALMKQFNEKFRITEFHKTRVDSHNVVLVV